MTNSSLLADVSPENQRNLRKLVRAVRASCGKLNLLVALCDNPTYREQIISGYEAELRAAGMLCDRIQLDPRQPSLKQSLGEWVVQHPALVAVAAEEQAASPCPAMVTVLGAGELLGLRLTQDRSAQERFFFSLQWTREALREFRLPIVLWLTTPMAAAVAQQAPDFWSWRGGVFEFVQAQQPERIESFGGSPLENPVSESAELLADPIEVQAQIDALAAQDPDSLLLASLYQSLGITYRKRTEQGKAVDYSAEQTLGIAALQRSIALQTPQGDSPELATSLDELAQIYYAKGRYAEAEPLVARSLDIRERQLGADHPDVAQSLNNLAELYRLQGRYSEAEPLYARSLNIMERQLGTDHPYVAQSLNNLAELYRFQGRYSEAEPLYARSLNIMERQLGADYPYVATNLNNLALLYYSQGRYSEAEPLYARSLDICIASLGLNHPTTQQVRENLVTLYDELAIQKKLQGHYDQVVVYLEKAISLRTNPRHF